MKPTLILKKHLKLILGIVGSAVFVLLLLRQRRHG